jgi:arabinofuranosyltransferase
MFRFRRASAWPQGITTLIAALGTAAFVTWSWVHGAVGFPLDDAWIHQTYARNLAQTGQLAYLPGQLSAGSTSPAWSFLLSAGYLLGVDYRLWAHLLGGLALAATALLSYRLFLRLPPSLVQRLGRGVGAVGRPGPISRSGLALLAGLLCAAEWHLVWASASGMETILFTALSLALLDYYFSQLADRRSPPGPVTLQTERSVVGAVGIGLLGGILTLTRPEGLGLAGLVIGAMLLFPPPAGRPGLKARLLPPAASLLSLGLVLAPYLAFNLGTAGSIFPNTFYAKQVEYHLRLSALVRLWRVSSPTLVGGQVLLLPGVCYAGYLLIRRRRWFSLLPLLWGSALVGAYALLLPVTYQHGRYAMPVIPLLLVYGVSGTAALTQPWSRHLLVRVSSRALPLAVVLLTLFFWARGAVVYGEDVAFIQGEMVATAHWLNDHTTPGDLIAVHDIGAVGYLTQRPLLDLAGLITPEVIPFMTDAGQLANWMIQRGATYAVFFPDFSATYSRLAADPRLQQVHCTGFAWTRSVGHQNLCVYRLSPKE